ncbi:Rne/Rng family ribonuclease [Cohaesibacter celericrescens]|uniref:Ribonuclease E n=2 Tax=Cohaesibacter celericrescens TaxID=2067669 RepID=A0A2N5XSF9_9HYPH|nr:ribonuclease E/G [Cohaesibacter celericrescens]PLW77434.1 ribonuclease E/G [Cohaesibacter celericrescens]
MANQMLVDATHPEETRVVVVRGSRVEEFDFESANRKQLRGNIYLAKVTRVEPSLQAAFVDYGGNRHGFLAFSEIHPDYYQIPVADRQALLDEEKSHHTDDDDNEVVAAKPARKRRSRKSEKAAPSATPSDASSSEATEAVAAPSEDSPVVDDATNTASSEQAASQDTTSDSTTSEDTASSDDGKTPPAQAHAAAAEESVSANPDEIAEAEELSDNEKVSFVSSDDDDEDDDENGDDESGDVEHVGAEDAMEEVPERRTRRRSRQYKIQEVIKRRQILLVQVVKEERGNKGAALTTYLSLAGRYSVLMPNTARGGGISRKITNIADRKRLKQIAAELEVADGMGVILRTAGASRTKTEIKRDFEYLLRLWENVRDLTLQSAAPLLVYEEGSLIKRSIRDLYNKDIDQVLVAGDEGYKEAKGFMRMLMPSHARNVQPYREPQPIFTRMGIEPQLDAMFSPQVTLKSGGYIVIDQTEALVSIDVNSGRSTREHNIEDTAVSTNLEASEEISRQLRLRDLAGLVVIDFIDMEEKRNNRAVEKRLKDCLKSDRARIQVGRISHFGLMEMSRQRIRTGVLESTMDPCPHCHGTGYVRASESVALLVLRTIEDHLLKGVTHNVVVKTRTSVALYILNQKRNNLNELESRFGAHISIEVDDDLEGKHLEIERGDPLEVPIAPTPTVSMLTTDDLDEEDDDDLEINAIEEKEREEESSSKKRRRRRRRKKSSPSDVQNATDESETSEQDAESSETAEDIEAKSDDEDEDGKPKKSRRRGRRGGRRNRRNRPEDGEANELSAEGTEAGNNAIEDATDGSSDDVIVKSDQGTVVAETQETTQTAEAKEVNTSSNETSDAPETSSQAEQASDGSQIETKTAPAASEVIETPPAQSETVATEATPVETPAEPVASVAPATPQMETATADNSIGESAAEPKAEADTKSAAEPEAAPVAEKPAAAKEEAPEGTRPKRSGWWNRSGFL